MALVFCLLGTTVPLTALAAGEDGEVQYIVSNDGTTLTIQGDGEITSQALDANVTAEQKKTLTSVEIGAGVTGIADGYSSVFPAGVTNVTLKGSGSFPKLKILYPNPRLRYFQNTLLCGYSESSASSWLPLDKESVSSICIATGRCFHTPAGC